MNVVISGTSRGIGKAMAERFLREGDLVFGLDQEPGTITDENYTHFICDVSCDEFPQLPKINILISNAGTLNDDDAIRVNLLGAVRFTEYYVQSLSLHSVLFIASASAINGMETPLYSASKAGVVGFMKNAALRLAKRGVTCNSISPGGVITDANRHILNSETLYAAVKAETLLGKWAEPEEIADLAYFLTKINRSMTGENILIDNGEMLKSNFIW